MTDNQEDKLPWAVGRCCFTNDNPPPLLDGTLYKSASYKFSRTTDIHSLFKGTYAQIPESEARQILEDRKRLSMLEEAARRLIHIADNESTLCNCEVKYYDSIHDLRKAMKK